MAPSDEKRSRLLIADDDDHTRNLLKELCEGWGYDTVLAENGEEAVQRAGGGVDLALLDLMMPKLDGFEVLKALRSSAATQRLPVIVLTAIGDVDGKIKGIELGADDYVTKPFRISDLQQRIRAILDKASYREHLRATEPAAAPIPAPAAPVEKKPSTDTDDFPKIKEALEYELERAHRYGHSLAALVVAVDDYALVFDELGRQPTNELLINLGDALRGCLREVDRLFRVDVDAFVVLLPETHLEGGSNAAQRIHQVLTSKPLAVSARREIQISIGVADYPRHGVDSPEDLVRAALRALRRAQRQRPGSIELAER